MTPNNQIGRIDNIMFFLSCPSDILQIINQFFELNKPFDKPRTHIVFLLSIGAGNEHSAI